MLSLNVMYIVRNGKIERVRRQKKEPLALLADQFSTYLSPGHGRSNNVVLIRAYRGGADLPVMSFQKKLHARASGSKLPPSLYPSVRWIICSNKPCAVRYFVCGARCFVCDPTN